MSRWPPEALGGLPLSSRPVPDEARRIAGAVREAGGRALLVGGFVRDSLLGLPVKDVDMEVFGLAAERLTQVLSALGRVDAVGRSFGVLKVLGADVSLPRRDSKRGAGHKGFLVSSDPDMPFEEAARRRDFTMNAMGFDPVTGELLDPWGGRRDLADGVLRMVHAETFVEDPLRPLRAAQLLARFSLRPDPELVRLSREVRHTLLELPGERLWEEWVKLLLAGREPSRGLLFLHEAGIDAVLFPELAALAGCPQDPDWHPEGDVLVHTGMALDAAVELRNGDREHDLALMAGVLCHDLGKPPTTVFERGRWRSPGHEPAGIPPARAFLERLRAPVALVETVSALVADHLAPAHLSKGDPTPRAYRRLARRLEEAGASMDLLYRVARADHFGRTTPDALARSFPAGDAFLAAARALHVEEKADRDVVLGRHLIARGLTPGPAFGEVLERCRDVQDETGLKEPEAILERVLGPASSTAGQ